MWQSPVLWKVDPVLWFTSGGIDFGLPKVRSMARALCRVQGLMNHKAKSPLGPYAMQTERQEACSACAMWRRVQILQTYTSTNRLFWFGLPAVNGYSMKDMITMLSKVWAIAQTHSANSAQTLPPCQINNVCLHQCMDQFQETKEGCAVVCDGIWQIWCLKQ